MLAICRVGDMGIGSCASHPPSPPIPITVNIIQGDPTVITEGSPTAQIGSLALCSCGHMGFALTGAATVISSAIGVHRLSDMGLPPSGTYNMITGATRSFSGA